MKKTAFLLYIVVLVLSSLACEIVVVSDGKPKSPAANAVPTPANALPTPKNCLVVRALPGGNGTLNLREGPGTSYGVLAVLEDGQILVMDGKNGDWYAVKLVMDGRWQNGFVHASYVETCK